VSVCVTEVGSVWWRDYSSDSQPLYLLCFVLCDNKRIHLRSLQYNTAIAFNCSQTQ